MRTNVSIKFNSIEEYRVIEQKLEELGYGKETDFTEEQVLLFELDRFKIFKDGSYWLLDFSVSGDVVYNSLEEFLEDQGMEELHKEFIEELQDLLKKYNADISLNRNMYDQDVIQIDFNRTNERNYSNINIEWIDKDDIAIED